MSRVWLLHGCDEELAALRREVALREPDACLVCVRRAGEMVLVAGALDGAGVAALIGTTGMDPSALEGLIAALRGIEGVTDILVRADGLDAGVLARCFYAGATEVIAAGGAEASGAADNEAVCGKELTDRAGQVDSAGDDDGEADAAPATAGVGTPSRGQETAGRTGSLRIAVDDLETPPWEPIDDGCAAVGEAASAASAPLGSEPAVAEEVPDALRERFARSAAGACDYGAAAGGAPLIAVVSGRGGCGKTTITAAMAACAARAGLRCAVLDFDLMLGNMAAVMGIDAPIGLDRLGAYGSSEPIAEADVETTAMRIGPGLTLWGPCLEPERADLIAGPAEQMIEMLRGLADVLFVDTSGYWGDAVAMAVGACDRCLVVGGSGAPDVASAQRAMKIAMRLGVPATRMTSVFNRLGAPGCGEDRALRFEMGVSLRSRVRIADGGDEVASMLSFGHIDRVVAGSGPFADSVRSATAQILRELGCDVGALSVERPDNERDARPRVRLPWGKKAGERR